jgi:hypothetical protein
VYTTSYPAYWAYSGMAPAYANTGMRFSKINIANGKIVGGTIDQSVLESGDELYVDTAGGGSQGCSESTSKVKLWVFDANKNTTALTVPAASRNLYILDSAGTPYSKSNVGFRILRSGHRNLLGNVAGTATSMANPIQNISGTRKLLLNTGSNVVAASATAFREKWQGDNDDILKTSFAIVNCVMVETPDCNGTLQNHLNPYLKGLIGNYKPYRNYVYYGSRVEGDPAVNTTIRKNGYLSGFSNYWNFDGNSNLTPDNTNANWVWNSQLTKVNSKGQELETKDALNRYTAAQYGYAKELPVAVTNNAGYNEAAYEGFEDNDYLSSIDGNGYSVCSNAKHFDLSSMANGKVVSTDTLPFNAHTGKRLLQVSPGSTATRNFTIGTEPLDSFSLQVGTNTPQVLYQLGGTLTASGSNTTYVSTSTYWKTALPPPQGTGDYQLAYFNIVNNSSAGYSGNYTYNCYATFYIQITQPGVYSWSKAVQGITGSLAITPITPTLDISIQSVTTGAGVPLTTTSTSTSYGAETDMFSACLLSDIYKITMHGYNYYRGQPCPSPCSYTGPTDWYYLSLMGSPQTLIYKNLTTTGSCTSNIPIAGKDSMLNSSFIFPAGKQMTISAWAREGQGLGSNGLPDTVTNYVNDQIVINDGTQNITLRPAGPIVEGWQRYEGNFTPSASATTGSISFINPGSKTVYFDDIRIHPFNANMKSYVYDPRTLRLSAELDENNYATFYDYDEEGQLIRVKRETIQGIKTIKESRSAKQKNIKTVQ